MQTCWLNQHDNPDCILFMAGWGMGPEPFRTVMREAVDVFMVYDYRSLEDCDLTTLLPTNRRLHLLAWSMGVWVAGRLLEQVVFSSATALGGTCRPVDDRYGIPHKVFRKTIAHFSPDVLHDFYNAMFDNTAQARQFLARQPDRPLAELKDELVLLYDSCRLHPEAADIFQTRIVTSRDRIFPARNQIRAWGRDNCTSVVLPHFPFYQWTGWMELLETE